MQSQKRIQSHILRSIILIVILGMAGCIPQRELLYFQDHNSRKGYENPYNDVEIITEKYILQINDALIIRVNTSNPKLSEYFNNTSSSGGQAGGQSSLFTYNIDDFYEIDFPFVGKINLEGCNLTLAKEKIKEALVPYVSDAQVTVRMSSPYFLALGEFGGGGRISMGKEQITIFEAVALAGDVKVFGKKRKLKIIRPTENGAQTYIVDLTDYNILDSDMYYIYPNDILYARPMRAKIWGIGESFSLGLITTAIALYLTLNTLTK